MIVEVCGLRLDLDVKVSKGRPATGPTYDCGGQPAEPDEINYLKAIVVNAKGGYLADFDINEYLSIVNEKESERIDMAVLNDYYSGEDY